VRAPALSPKDARATKLGALLLAPVLVWVLLVRPYVRALADVRERVSEERELLARERRLVTDAPHFPERRHRAGSALGATWTHIVRGADTLSVTATLTSYASDAAAGAGLLVEQVESRGADSIRMARLTHGGGGLVASTVELRARGDLERVLRFVAELESGETYVRVDRLQMVKAPSAGDAADQETLTVTATITAIARVLSRPASFYATPMPPRPRHPRSPAQPRPSSAVASAGKTNP
jgi:hypothetical protein